jgi:hypothetical protein
VSVHVDGKPAELEALESEKQALVAESSQIEDSCLARACLGAIKSIDNVSCPDCLQAWGSVDRAHRCYCRHPRCGGQSQVASGACLAQRNLLQCGAPANVPQDGSFKRSGCISSDVDVPWSFRPPLSSLRPGGATFSLYWPQMTLTWCDAGDAG